MYAQWEDNRKCYYDDSTQTFVWTTDGTDKTLYNNFKTEEACNNASMKLTIKDSSGNLRDCSSGTCGEKTNEITLNLKPGTYQLDQLSGYKIENADATLSGWKVPSYNNGYQFESGASTRAVDSSLTFSNATYQWTIEAIWEDAKESYTVIYNVEGGTPTPIRQTKEEGVDLKLSTIVPTKEGFVFNGWNTKQDGSGKTYNPGDLYTNDENLFLYAQWKESDVTVKLGTFNNNDGYIIIDSKTTLADLDENITVTPNTYTVSLPEKLITGSKIKILKSDNTVYDEYIIVITGDVDSDGEIGTMDYMFIYAYFKGTKTLNQEQKLAADFDKDGEIITMDYMKIYKLFNGGE